MIGNFKRSVSLAKKGNYIALCDQDDIWLPVKLEKQYQALLLLDDKKSPAIVYSDLTVIDQQKKIPRILPPQSIVFRHKRWR